MITVSIGFNVTAQTASQVVQMVCAVDTQNLLTRLIISAVVSGSLMLKMFAQETTVRFAPLRTVALGTRRSEMVEQCGNCCYFLRCNSEVLTIVEVCARYPSSVSKQEHQWCGEWSPSEEYDKSVQKDEEQQHIPEGWCQSCARTDSCTEELFVAGAECINTCDKHIQKQE